MRNWPFVYGLLSDPELSRVKPGQVGTSPIPVAESGDESFSGLGGWNLLINAAAEDKLDALWTFIRVHDGPRAAEGADLPEHPTAHPEEPVRGPGGAGEGAGYQAQGEALANARPRPVSPYYSDMSLEMAEQFNAALKDVPVERALNNLQRSLQEIVDQP
jgi:multiple sugar transport system substrate-binding protein